MAFDKKLHKECEAIYKEDGKDAVIKYCQQINHKLWGSCKQCQVNWSGNCIPLMDDQFMSCLVCGHSTYYDNENKPISFSIAELSVLLEASNYQLDSIKNNGKCQTRFEADKYRIEKVIQKLERMMEDDYD